MTGELERAAAPRVLELGTGIAVAWAGRLLADGGADVIALEPPGGHPLRHAGPFRDGADADASGLFIATHVNKRARVVDLESSEGREALATLLGWAEILIIDLAPAQATALAIDAESLRSTHPDLVVLSLTPFGVTGPRAHWQATELTVLHGGGWANLCPNAHTDPDLPPLKVFGEQSAFLSGTCGALVALATWRSARASGVGEFIDLSAQAYIASVLEASMPLLGYKEFVSRRYQPRGLIPWGIFPARDGLIFIACIEQDQWERLVAFMGAPDWATLEVFADQAGRRDNQDLLHSLLAEFIAEWEVEALYHAAQAQRICLAPVLTYAQIERDPHLAARCFFESTTDGHGRPLPLFANPILKTAGRAPLRTPAPRLQDALSAGTTEPARVPMAPHPNPLAALPLAGIRVIDLSWAWAGPFCATLLAHLGADVIRVESSVRPDLYRRMAISPDDVPTTLNTCGMFNQWHQGKRSVAISLRTPEGRELLRELIQSADVVVQNFGTGVLERMGLGYETLKRINPGIVLASVSGYGQTGPLRHYMGYGPSAAALSGLCSVTGYPGGAPDELGLSMPDPTSGLTAALGVVEALVRRDVTGTGDHIDVSLWEATAVHGLEAWLAYVMTGTPPERIGNRHPTFAPHGCYRCLTADDWVTIACRSEEEWQRLVAHVDETRGETLPPLSGDPRFATAADRKRNEDALDAHLAAWTSQRGRWVITRDLQALGIPAFPSLSTRDVVDDAHLNARGFIERLTHPEVGARPHAGIPWRFSARANGVRSPAPCIGADTETVLAELPGFDAARIAALRATGVLE
ncbi:MAG: CaiB/BaiF CoA transferase family protein [Pseudomonadales bacterium]